MGRGDQPVHQHGQDDYEPPADQARRAAGDPHRARGRLPDVMARLLRALSPRSWLRAPRRTARLRLTLLYTGMFLGLGTALVVGVFLLSSHGQLVHAQSE